MLVQRACSWEGMTLSGSQTNKFRVKVNGQNWDTPSKGSAKPVEEKQPSSGRKQIQGPALSPAELAKMSKREDAWDRMIEIRGTAGEERVVHPERDFERDEDNQPDYGELDYSGGRRRGQRIEAIWPKKAFVRIFLTTGGAVAVGLIFGIMVLTIFSQEQFKTSYRSVLSDTVQTLTAQSTDQGEQKTHSTGTPLLQEADGSAVPSAPADASQSVSLQLPELKMFVAQAGVFQADTPAEAAAAPLTQKGLPHLLYNDSSKQYMFAAAATNREAALGFASNIKDKGIEVYVKEFSFPAFHGAVQMGQSTDAANHLDLPVFFSKGRELVEALSANSGLVITAQPASGEVAKIKETHRKFLESGKVSALPAEWQPHFQQMVNGLNQAVTARDKMAEASTGQKTQSAEQYAWQVQAGILTYLESYMKWIQQVENNQFL